MHSKSFVFFACSRSLSMNIVVSSAYYKIDNPSSTKWGITPLIWPSSFAFVINMESISTTILNRIGDMGSPCVRHGYLGVPTDQGPRGPCQVDPTCQKSCRPASGLGDLIHNPGDPGIPWTTLSRSQKTRRACGERFSLVHGGGAASRPEDRGILSVITEGDLL
jgi:hypothetical protein